MRKVFGTGVVVFLLTAAAFAAPTPIVDKNKVEHGIVLHNPYAYVAVMNPSRNRGDYGARDFRVLPLTRPDGGQTLDDSEAMLRFMLRPELSVSIGDGRTARNLKSEDGCALRGQSDYCVTLAEVFGKAPKDVHTTVNVTLDEERSALEAVLKVKNASNQKCTVTYAPALYALIPELQPVRLVLPRQVVRYQVGGKVTFWRNERTELNNDFRRYWWRKPAERRGAGMRLNYEQIVFDQKQVPAPQSMGVTELRGGAAAVWGFDDKVKPDGLNVHWLRDLVQCAPIWHITLEPNESREVRFQILMVRGLPRYDNVEKDWVFAYVPDGHTLRVFCAPLKPEKRVSLNLTVEDSQGHSLVIRRGEMAATSPLQPGKLIYRTSAPLQPLDRYPIQVQLDSIADNSRLLEVKGAVTP